MPTTSQVDLLTLAEVLRPAVDAVPEDQRRTARSGKSQATAQQVRDDQAADVIATVVSPGATRADSPRTDAASGQVAAAYGIDLAQVLAAEKVRGRVGEVTRVPVLRDGLPQRWMLVGIGDGSAFDRRRAAAALARATRSTSTVATSLADGAGVAGTRAVIEGFLLGAHREPFTGRKARTDNAPAERLVLTGRVSESAVEAGLRHARAGVLTRDLAAVPSSVKNPGWLAAQAQELVSTLTTDSARNGRGASADSLRITVLHAEQLTEQGFGGLLAVGGGSATPPALVRIDYTPPATNSARPASGTADAGRVVLIGKGITFDTGGISLKPRASMVTMKTDMAGAAAVLATILACPQARVRRPVTALLALAENHLSGSAYRPSDVVTVYGGHTVEIGNTDAEGRIVLADALAYADAVLDPAVVIDVATLTGAANLTLGRRFAPLMTDDDALANALIAAGEAAGEQLWRMPMPTDYLGAIASQIADVRQVPERDLWGAGAITPAIFLRTFVGDRRWAHLDIAGAGRSTTVSHELGKGPTGFGARLLLRWLETLR